MASSGLPCNEDIITDGKIRRYSSDGNNAKKDEWYIAHEGISLNGNPYLNVVFGSWSEDSRYDYSSFKEHASVYSQQEREEIRERIKKKRLEADALLANANNHAAQTASWLMESSSTVPLMPAHSAYIQTKGITIFSLVRYGIDAQGNHALIIPLYDRHGSLRNVQTIAQNKDGTFYKRFLSGGQKKGNFHVIGNLTHESGIVFLVEGYATGASVYEATKVPVVVCFDAGNIESVLASLKIQYPTILYVIAADNDKNGVGVYKAEQCKKKYEVRIAVPDFGSDFTATSERDASDFNDLHALRGIDEVRRQLIDGTRRLKLNRRQRRSPHGSTLMSFVDNFEELTPKQQGYFMTLVIIGMHFRTIYMGQKRLASRAGCHERTVRRANKPLSKLGWIQVNSGGYLQSNRTDLHPLFRSDLFGDFLHDLFLYSAKVNGFCKNIVGYLHVWKGHLRNVLRDINSYSLESLSNGFYSQREGEKGGSPDELTLTVSTDPPDNSTYVNYFDCSPPQEQLRGGDRLLLSKLLLQEGIILMKKLETEVSNCMKSKEFEAQEWDLSPLYEPRGNS